jgi:hypothetical protein
VVLLDSQKLPESLSKWLSPESGQPRHIPTLQVSFGSNDEFFASDQFGKISSRDSSPLVEIKKPTPRLANIARGFMKRRSYTVSSPTLPPDLQTKAAENIPGSRLERRNTIMEGQPSPKLESRQSITPIREHQILRLDSKPDYLKAEERLLRPEQKPERPNSENRRSILGAPPSMRPTWPDRRSILMARDRLPVIPTVPIAPVKPPIAMEPTVPMGTMETKPLGQNVKPPPKSYVDAEAQTDGEAEDYYPPLGELMLMQGTYMPTIGSMSDFFRGQCMLGDALWYV